MADDNADDPFFQALMQLTDTNKKVINWIVWHIFEKFRFYFVSF